MSAPALLAFHTERELTNYADRLNEAGMSPEIPIMDSAGICAFATLQAPGGDGWGFAYYTVNDPDSGEIRGDEGGWVKPTRYLGEYEGDWNTRNAWQPSWPVFGIVIAMGR